jgi:hypothetical protein
MCDEDLEAFVGDPDADGAPSPIAGCMPGVCMILPFPNLSA